MRLFYEFFGLNLSNELACNLNIIYKTFISRRRNRGTKVPILDGITKYAYVVLGVNDCDRSSLSYQGESNLATCTVQPDDLSTSFIYGSC